MSQFVRDARIAQIYEGTNGVQAMDLVGRKLSMAGGAVAAGFFDLVANDLAQAAQTRDAALIAESTTRALDLLRQATAGLGGADVDALGAAAVDYLRLFALVSFGWMWARMAAAAASGDTPFHASKKLVANFFATRVLPQADALAASIAGGEDAIMALDVDAF